MDDPASTRSLYTVEQVRALDRAAIDVHGVAGFTLMQRAAAAAFALLRRRWPQARRILVLAGSGNNGGDAFLVAALALQAGMQVQLVALDGATGVDAACARQTFTEAGGRIVSAGSATLSTDSDVAIDGLFGTGLRRAVDGVAADLIRALAQARIPTLALDVPSGLDADTGVATGPVVAAAATIAFVGWKRGMFTADGPDLCGACELATLELPPGARAAIPADAELLDHAFLDRLAPRKANVNKGSFGHVLVIGGDEGMAGAVRLAGEAALRAGSGLVSVATRAAHVGAINAGRPELMARGVDGPQALAPMIDRATVLALGPGLGQAAWGHALWDGALRSGKPVVVDADALNLLGENASALPATAVLTPHPGEAARLLGCEVAAIQRDRFAAVRALARRYVATVVLKGAGSLIGSPDGRVAVCPFGNSGMATAGMGDVLTGVIAGLLAQGLDARDAACLGTLVHALAGDRAAADVPRGLIASDLFAVLRELVNGGAR